MKEPWLVAGGVAIPDGGDAVGGAPALCARAVAAPASPPRDEPRIVFVSADPDLLGGLAFQDTTMNQDSGMYWVFRPAGPR